MPLFLTATTTGTFNDTFENCVQSAMELGWQVEFTDRSTGLVVARVPGNLRTWSGQSVTAKVSNVAIGIRVDVTSTSRGAQYHNYGRNRANIESFLIATARRAGVAYAPGN